MKPERPEPPPKPLASHLGGVQLAFVTLGDITFHTRWFHSAAIAPIIQNPPRKEDKQAELTINLVSTQGMGPGFKISGTVEEITQAYASLMQQLGYIDPRRFAQAQAQKEEQDDQTEAGTTPEDDDPGSA